MPGEDDPDESGDGLVISLVLTLAATCWGLGTVVSKRAIAEVPPLTLSFWVLSGVPGTMCCQDRNGRNEACWKYGSF